MLEAGVVPSDVTDLFFTHYHFDHLADYPSFLLTRWDQSGGIDQDLNVFGPIPLHRINNLLFGEDGVYSGDILARTSLAGSLERYQSRGGKLPRPRPNVISREIGHEDEVQMKGGDRVTAIQGYHAAPYLECLSYRLDTSEGSVVYTGDTAPNTRLTALSRGCDVLIHMCAYLEGSAEAEVRGPRASSHMDAARAARDAGAKKLVLTHLNPGLATPGKIAAIKENASSVFDGEIIIGEDLLEIEYCRKTTGIRWREEEYVAV